MLFPVLLGLLMAGAVAQRRGEEAPLQLQALADQANGVPPEFSADILLKVAGHPGAHAKNWKIEKIEDAFTVAAGAQNAYKRIGGKHTDTRESRQGWDHGLDTLSLRCRAVEQMLDVDPTRARGLFERTKIPELPNPACNEALVADIGIYYKILFRVLQQGFSRSDRAEGRDTAAIEEQIRLMRWPCQIAPLADVILRGADSSRKQQLLSLLATSLQRVTTTDRQFAACETEIWSLLYRLRDAQAELSVWNVAIRDLLVRHYTQPRCPDRVSSDDLPEAAKELNAFLERLRHDRSLPENETHPIASSEVTPKEIAGSFKLTEFWQSPDAARILAGLRWLHHGNRGLPGPQRFWSDSERASADWEAKRVEVVKLLDSWHEDSEDAASVYHMKVDAYLTLAELTPEGQRRENALAELISTIEIYYHRLENRAEWFTGFAKLLQRMAQRGERSKLSESLKRSRNPVLSLYAGWLEIDSSGRTGMQPH